MKTRIREFMIGEPIGSTPNARVYAALRDMGDGLTQDAAVKMLRVVSESPAEREEIRKEAEILARLGSSANIVTMLDFGVEEDVGPWLAMERLGDSLKDRIGDDPADPNFVRRVASDALQGLAAIHNNNPSVLHRDVKPGHLLSTPAGSWKLIDFGLASTRDNTSTLNLLTVQYAAPELLDRQLGPMTPATDLYALGMTLYQLALGEKLYRPQFPSVYDDDLAKWEPDNSDRWPKWMFWHCSMEQVAKPLSELLPGYPQELSDAIASMMVKQPDQRVGTAEEVLANLGSAANVPAAGSGPRVVNKPGFSGSGRSGSQGGAQPNTWSTASGGFLQPDQEEQAKKSGVSPLILVAVAATLLLSVSVLAFIMFSGGRDPIQVNIPADQSSKSALIPVEGRIMNLPPGWTAELRTASGEPVELNLDPQRGTFEAEVVAPNLGEMEVQLALINASGAVSGERRFTVERLPPAVVNVTFQIQPPIEGASVRVFNPTTQATLGDGQTNARGEFELTIPFGPYSLEVVHPRYERFVATTETQPLSSYRLPVNLVASQMPATLTVVPASASVVVKLAETGEEIVLNLDSGGNVETELPLGRHEVLLERDGYVSQASQIEVRKASLNRFTFTLESVRAASQQQEDTPKAPVRDWRLLTEEQLLALPLNDLKDVVEAYYGLEGLEFRSREELNHVQIRGVLHNQRELQELVLGVRKAGDRIQVAARPDHDALGRQIQRWLNDNGDTVSRVTSFDNLIFIRRDEASPLSREAIEEHAHKFVYDTTLVEVQ